MGALKDTPKEFNFPASWPRLMTNADVSAYRKAIGRTPSQHYRSCSICGLMVPARPYRGHVKACSRRKRERPVEWKNWRLAHHGPTEHEAWLEWRSKQR